MSKMIIDRTPRRYLQDGDVDVVARQNTQLMAELWVVKDRLAVLETLLVEAGVLAEDAVSSYAPEGALAERLEHERAAYVERVASLPGDDRTVESLKRRSATVRARS